MTVRLEGESLGGMTKKPKPAAPPPPQSSPAGVSWKGPDALRPLLVPIETLKGDPKNARHHDERSFEGIRVSLQKFGQRKTIVVDSDGVVVAGNGTLEAARREGWSHLAVADTSGLTPEEIRAFALADNRTAELSSWDYGALLTELEGLQPELVDAAWFTPLELDQMTAAIQPPDNGAEGTEPGATYTSKIVSPIYEPKNEKPAVHDLVDRTKTTKLRMAIDAANLPDDVATFLKLAAERHTVFDYRRIADFYAHSPAEVQRLFEASALVIIDWDKAVEHGYVHMSKRIGEFVREELAAKAALSGDVNEDGEDEDEKASLAAAGVVDGAV